MAEYNWKIAEGWVTIAGIANAANFEFPSEFADKPFLVYKATPSPVTWKFKEIPMTPEQINALMEWLNSLPDDTDAESNRTESEG